MFKFQLITKCLFIPLFSYIFYVFHSFNSGHTGAPIIGEQIDPAQTCVYFDVVCVWMYVHMYLCEYIPNKILSHLYNNHLWKRLGTSNHLLPNECHFGFQTWSESFTPAISTTLKYVLLGNKPTKQTQETKTYIPGKILLVNIYTKYSDGNKATSFA